MELKTVFIHVFHLVYYVGIVPILILTAMSYLACAYPSAMGELQITVLVLMALLSVFYGVLVDIPYAVHTGGK